MDMDRYRRARLRMHQLQEVTELDRESMQPLRDRIRSLRSNIEQGVTTPVFSSDNLFVTPAWLAQKIMALADIQPGHTVLEPSAGTGNLLRELPTDISVTACEISNQLCGHIYRTFPQVRIIQGDFMDQSPGTFDRIIMNPPFRRRSDLRHIAHARKFLKPGGRLVALCLDGPQRAAALQHDATTWTVIPGAFRAEHTNVSVVLLSIDQANHPKSDSS